MMQRLNDNAQRKRRRRFVSTSITSILVVAALIWILATLTASRNVEERLAAIEADRAVPDSENAAIVYRNLLTDPNAGSIQEPKSVRAEDLRRACRGPWSSNELPELAAWVTEHRPVVDKLVEVANFEKCWFPINLDVRDQGHTKCVGAMNQWGMLLAFTANLDAAEGRVEQALAEWQSAVGLGNHLRQPIGMLDHNVASIMARYAIESMARYIMEGDPSEADLCGIEAMPLAIDAELAVHQRQIDAVEELRHDALLEPLGPIERLKFHYTYYRMSRPLKEMERRLPQRPNCDSNICTTCLKHVATARGLRILVALRRHRNATERWPDSLDRIKPMPPQEVLTDPLNNDPFAYQRHGDTFALYSKGWNGIDEGAESQSEKEVDDVPIWPVANSTPNI